MAQLDFVMLQEKHVGGKVIRAFGKRWRLGFRVRPEDVGRRIYRTEEGGIELEDQWEDRGLCPSIFEICSHLNLDLLQGISDETYALGESRPDGAVTPWFETIDELELYCEENLDAFRQ